MLEGFPELTDSFLSGQDVLYTQFNDIEFYVEDVDQEHFYFNLFKKLFPDIKFEKIFPLNGKDNVINSAISNTGNKRKVYIVDSDFDHILGTVTTRDNVFYLNKYSIENYLISKPAIYEVIRSKNTKLKDFDIDQLIDYNHLIHSAAICLKELASSFIVIQQYKLGLSFYGVSISRDYDFHAASPFYRLHFIRDYLNSVEIALRQKDKRLSLRAQIRKLKGYFKGIGNALSNIPGKHLLTFIKERLQALNLIHQMSIESFSYTLSKEFSSPELNFLKTGITNYIK